MQTRTIEDFRLGLILNSNKNLRLILNYNCHGFSISGLHSDYFAITNLIFAELKLSPVLFLNERLFTFSACYMHVKILCGTMVARGQYIYLLQGGTLLNEGQYFLTQEPHRYICILVGHNLLLCLEIG